MKAWVIEGQICVWLCICLFLRIVVLSNAELFITMFWCMCNILPHGTYQWYVLSSNGAALTGSTKFVGQGALVMLRFHIVWKVVRGRSLSSSWTVCLVHSMKSLMEVPHSCFSYSLCFSNFGFQITSSDSKLTCISAVNMTIIVRKGSFATTLSNYFWWYFEIRTQSFHYLLHIDVYYWNWRNW